ncbi:MAG: alpha-L-rhamnosidase N-terminal domain-containing protein, partial [Ginsengibacter sp.]
VFINGKKVGDELLGPPFSDYYKRIMYVTKDITTLVKNGENILGAMLGNGYFNPPNRGFGERNSGNGPPALMLQATITFTDGTQQTIQTDESWKWAKSEIVMNDLWGNYEEDRIQAKTGWNNNGYKDSSWSYAKIINPPPGKLSSSVAPAIEIIGLLKPYEIQDSLVKFKENIDGWPQIKLDGKAGQTIVVSSIDGNVKTQSLTFKLASDGPTILQPHFVIFTGTTSLEIEGLSSPLLKEDISILQVNANVAKAGSFECSNPYLNQLFKVVTQTQQNYLYDFPADPSREKQGWTQDAQNMFTTAAFFSSVNGLYEKWWQDMADNQDSQGYLGSVVPMVNRQVYDWNSPWWSGALVFLPWNLYQFYGDKRILEKAFEPMKKYVNFLGKMASTGEGKNWDNYPYFEDELDTNAAKERMLIWNGAGDWLNPYTKTQFAVSAPQTTMPAYFYYATILKKTALLLNKNQDAAKYEELANDIRTRFNNKYFHPETGWYGDSTNNQTAQVLPLAVGLVAEENKNKVYQRLLDAIHARNDHIGTGFVATPFLLEQLAKYHESKLSNRIVNQKDYPSWNTLIKDGTLMETWSGDGAQMPSCGGSIGTWLFESVLGIQPLEPGFKKFIIAPKPDVSTGLISATGSYKCVYGKIVSSWKYENENFSLHVEIPVNSKAVIYLPAANMNDINESGVTLKKVKEIKLLKIDGDFVVLEVESGSYNFVSKNVILK